MITASTRHRGANLYQFPMQVSQASCYTCISVAVIGIEIAEIAPEFPDFPGKTLISWLAWSLR
jgi:hypothetical protein